MNKIIYLSKRTSSLLAAILLVVGISIPVFVPSHAQAAQVANRYLQLSSSANGTISTDAGGNAVAAGNGGNGVKTKHKVGFKIGTTGNVGSIIIRYCTSPIFGVACTTPTGFNANNLPNASSTLVTTGFSSNNFSVDKTTNNPSDCNGATTTRDNCVLIKRGTAASETATTTVTIEYGGTSSDYITNPTSDNYSFYARISTYSDTAYTTQVDYGGVAASTAQQIDITAKVQEVLNFSVSPTSSTPNGSTCTALTDPNNGALILGDPTNGVLSTTTAYDAHSYFRVNTNTLNGTVISYSGDTLKSGSNSISSVGLGGGGGVNGVSSNPASSQFGLALDSSDTQSGNGYSFTDLAANNGSNIASHLYRYDQGNGTITSGGTAKFQFDTASTATPRAIAFSTGGVGCDTGSVRYLGNVSTSTIAGIYTTTITYIATGTY